jgi:hypothetical protein
LIRVTLQTRLCHFMIFPYMVSLLLSLLNNVGTKALALSYLIPEFRRSASFAI